jgi:F-type H+-transporting ATPase subunit b
MRDLLREVLEAEVEAQRLLADAQGKAADIRRRAAEEVEALRRAARAAAQVNEKAILDAVARQVASEEERITSACESEIAAIRRRFEERRVVVAEALASRVLPSGPAGG